MYINGVMNYTGSKFKLLEQILSEMDYSKSYFVDLFAGSFVVGANLVDKYDKLVINDIVSNIIDIHKGIVEGDDIINDMIKLSPNKENKDEFLELRKSYNENPTPSKLWALMLSCTNNLYRFNKKGEFNQTWGKRSYNDNTKKKIEEFVNHVRPHKDKLIFTSKHFNDVRFNELIYKKSMIYIDPPYGTVKNQDGSIGKKQISEAGYSGLWGYKDDLLLYDYCKNLDKMGSSFMLSGVLQHDGNITWILDKLISDGYNYKELDFNYNKVSRKKSDKNTIEIIVKNY